MIKIVIGNKGRNYIFIGFSDFPDPQNQKKEFQTPLRTSNGCPKGTLGCMGKYCPETCFCEDHCSFEKCLLYEKPDHCLKHANSVWSWDEWNMYWVAQVKMGNI